MSDYDSAKGEKKEAAQAIAKLLTAGTYFAKKEENGYAIFSASGNVKIGSIVVKEKIGHRLFKVFRYEQGMEPEGMPTEFTTSLLTPVWNWCCKNAGVIDGFEKPQQKDCYGKDFWKKATKEEHREYVDNYMDYLTSS